MATDIALSSPSGRHQPTTISAVPHPTNASRCSRSSIRGIPERITNPSPFTKRTRASEFCFPFRDLPLPNPRRPVVARVRPCSRLPPAAKVAFW
jgi:hypothetical protein